MRLDKATNYGVVRIELLEQIYNEMYSYQIQHRSEEEWPHRLLNYREVTGMRDVQVDGRPAVELQIQNNSGKYCANKDNGTETLQVQLIPLTTNGSLAKLRLLTFLLGDFTTPFIPSSINRRPVLP